MATSTSHAQTRQTVSKSQIAVHYARRNVEQPSTRTTDHGLHVFMKRELVPQFGQAFGMNDADAMAEMEKEMSRRYAPNPWDAPGGRGPPRMLRTKAEETISVAERTQDQAAEVEAGKSDEISDEQWDLFERRVGYSTGNFAEGVLVEF